MEEKFNSNEVVCFDTNAIWLYPIIKEYALMGKSLGMDYMSLGSLRYNERYFVGYTYKEGSNPCIELIAYIQYKMVPSKLTLNYMEVSEKYRGCGLSTYIIDEFVKRVITDYNIPVEATTLSSQGKQANLIGKFQKHFTSEVVETSKRSTR